MPAEPPASAECQKIFVAQAGRMDRAFAIRGSPLTIRQAKEIEPRIKFGWGLMASSGSTQGFGIGAANERKRRECVVDSDAV